MNVAASRLPQRRGNAPHSDGMYDQPLPRASSLDMSGLPLAKQLQMQAEDERMRKRLQAERERQEERNVQMGLFGGGEHATPPPPPPAPSSTLQSWHTPQTSGPLHNSPSIHSRCRG